VAMLTAGQEKAAEALRLPFGAIDASGSEVVPLSEGLFISMKDLVGIQAFGLAFDAASLLIASPKSKFQLHALFGNELEVSKPEFSPKSDTVVDFVAGKVIHGRKILPAGAEAGGLAPTLDPETRRWGFTDASGAFHIKPQFASATSFHGGYARVGDEKQQLGLVDPQGKIAASRKYYKLSRTANGVSSFRAGDYVGIVNISDTEYRAKSGNTIEYDGGPYSLITGFWNSYQLVSSKDGKFTKLPSNIREAMVTWSGAVVRDGPGKPWRLIDPDGKAVSNDTYPDVLQSYCGVIQASNRDLVGLLDSHGKWIVEPRYTYLLDFEFGWAYYRKNKSQSLGGMVSVKGQEILDGKLVAARCLGRVILAVEEAGPGKYQMAYFNTDGQRLKTMPQVDLGRR